MQILSELSIKLQILLTHLSHLLREFISVTNLLEQLLLLHLLLRCWIDLLFLSFLIRSSEEI